MNKWMDKQDINISTEKNVVWIYATTWMITWKYYAR